MRRSDLGQGSGSRVERKRWRDRRDISGTERQKDRERQRETERDRERQPL